MFFNIIAISSNFSLTIWFYLFEQSGNLVLQQLIAGITNACFIE